MRPRRLLPLLALSLVVPGALLAPARADTVLLKDGRHIDGVKAKKDGDAWVLSFPHGDIRIPAAQVKDALLEGEQGFEPRNDEERAKVAKGLLPFEGRWLTKAQRDAAIAKRKEETRKRIEAAKAHRQWRHRYLEKTKNFDFEFTIPPEIAKGYMDMMETYFAYFSKQWGVTRNPKQRLKVCFYHDYETFLEVSGAPRGALAYYSFEPGAPKELNFFYDRVNPEVTTAIMFHEAEHYLTHLIDLNFRYPHNFSEAMAEYYGGSAWDPAKKVMKTGGVQEGRLTEVMTDFQGGETKPLEKFLRNELDYDDYTWGWTFVHFMMETPKYASKFKDFYLALAKGKDVDRTDRGGMRTVDGDALLRAFTRLMGVKDVQALEREWHDYVKNGLKLATAYGYEEAAVAAMNTDRPIKAAKFFKLAIEKGTTNPTTYLRYGELLSRKTETQDEAIAVWRKGLEHDPLSANLYGEIGRALRRKGGEENEKEGRRLLELARDLDPDDADLQLLLEEALEKIRESEGGAGMGEGEPGMGEGEPGMG